MANDMGNITGRMVGRVIRAEDIERVLAQVPEQVWMWDEDVPSGVTSMSTVDVGVQVPMRVRHEIITHILCALPD